MYNFIPQKIFTKFGFSNDDGSGWGPTPKWRLRNLDNNESYLTYLHSGLSFEAVGLRQLMPVFPLISIKTMVNSDPTHSRNNPPYGCGWFRMGDHRISSNLRTGGPRYSVGWRSENSRKSGFYWKKHQWWSSVGVGQQNSSEPRYSIATLYRGPPVMDIDKPLVLRFGIRSNSRPTPFG